MDQTTSLNPTLPDKRQSVFDSITGKIADGLLTAAHKVQDGVAQIEEHPPQVLAGVAPTIGKYGHTTAKALEQSADYIRNVDLEELKEDAETKVRQNPGKSLLIAAGVGFILGALLKRRGL